jgi:hypothetical protein
MFRNETANLAGADVREWRNTWSGLTKINGPAEYSGAVQALIDPFALVLECKYGCEQFPYHFGLGVRSWKATLKLDLQFLREGRALAWGVGVRVLWY